MACKKKKEKEKYAHTKTTTKKPNVVIACVPQQYVYA